MGADRMRLGGQLRRGVARSALAVALAVAGSALVPFAPSPAQAQVADALGGAGKEVPDGTPLLLEADRLIYDRDAETVTAVGGVQIAYGEYRIVAREVSYDQGSGRLSARGDVEIVEPDGNRIYADEIDVTDDFAEGFVNALRVETVANTRFAAESAVRGDNGERTVFNSGVYTACERCAEHPERPLSWRIRAQTVIWNQKARTIRFEAPSFELFGQPLFDLPGFSVPDHTVKRKSGFLIPRARYASELGAGITVPYYLALDPSYDATVQATVFTRQGVLAEGQFRRKFQSGDLEVRVAGIAQLDPDAFDDGSADDTTLRAMAGARGDFRINERWQWGFDALAQTDRSFAATYDIDGYDAGTFVNNVYLVGLDDRSYFEIKAEQFVVQSSNEDRRDDEPLIYPAFDYERTFDRRIAGGEVSIDVSAVNLSRENESCLTSRRSSTRDVGFAVTSNCEFDPRTEDPRRLGNRQTGIAGDYARASGELSWKGLYTHGSGVVFEPLLAGRADGFALDVDEASAAGQPPITERDGLRTMVTAGGEVRYPVMARTEGSVHIFEPIAQLFVRPDEDIDGAIVNEDSQSLVFDETNLFDRDKFAGDDRIEGGTRTNIGFRYAGEFAFGLSIDAVVGQSVHLAGRNSFAREAQIADLTNVGAQSGLETDRSDYVAGVSMTLDDRFGGAIRGRLDESTLEVRRGEVEATYSGLDFSARAKYAFIDAQPDVERLAPRHQVAGAMEFAVSEHWSVNADATYDFETQTVFKRGAGIEYADECFIIGVGYSENRRNLDAIKRSVQFNVSLRTIGDFGLGRSVSGFN